MNEKIKLYSEITLGVILICIAFYFFFLPSTLVTGGVMGISIILENHFDIDPGLFLYAANGFLLLVGLVFLGKNFFFKTIYASLLTPTIILLFGERFLDLDPEFFLRHVEIPFFIAATVGSAITAVGLGLCFKNNATTGGMDVIQKIFVKYFKMPYSKTMYFTDFLVILVGGIIIVEGSFAYNVERVVFGFIAIVVVGFVVDYIALNAKPRRTAFIITDKPDEVRDFIYKAIFRGVTIVDVKGGYSKEKKFMLICTLEKGEWYKINQSMYDVDPNVFAFISTTKEVGGYYEDKDRKRRQVVEEGKQ